jgi:hypothetical protein
LQPGCFFWIRVRDPWYVEGVINKPTSIGRSQPREIA